MDHICVYAPGCAEVTRFALLELQQRGIRVAEIPGPDVTHLLLPVPSFTQDGRIRFGGILEHILSDLPENITVIGGKLDHSALAGYSGMDLLQDELYLSENAAITADCAIRLALQSLPAVMRNCPVLVIGWGRIGKCLADRLRCAGAAVTVAARKRHDRSILTAMGYGAADPSALRQDLIRYRIIFNTVPHPVLTQAQTAFCRKDCILLELASTPGITAERVIRASGLPARIAPESSGALIARTLVRLIAEREAVL